MSDKTHWQLPFDLDIPTHAYLEYAIPASVLSCHPAFTWTFYSYNIQVLFNQGRTWNDKVFKITPALDRLSWSKMGLLDVDFNAELTNSDSIPSPLIEWVIERLRRDRYVEVRLNEYYMPCRPTYMRRHFDIHINIVVGVDLQRRHFFVAGFGVKYSIEKISFIDFERAFFTPPLPHFQNQRSQFPWWKCFWSWTIILDLNPKSFLRPDFMQIALQLRDYIESRNSRMNAELLINDAVDAEVDGFWGIETYNQWFLYFQAAVRDQFSIDLRSTRTLWEHKRCMLTRVKLLVELGLDEARHILGTLVSIEEDSRMIRHLSFIYNRHHDPTHLREVHRILDRMRDNEMIVLPRLLASINCHVGC